MDPMRRFLLRAVRRLLKEIDVRLVRGLEGAQYFTPPENRAELERWRRFFRTLDICGTGAEAYREVHLERLAQTMTLIPLPGASGRALELGCYMQMAAALAIELGYPEVRGAYLGPAGTAESKAVTIAGREVFRCGIDLFDAERDPFPYAGGHFDCVLACEIIEHLSRDPMHMLLEIRRVLSDAGTLILTTPNSASLRSIAQALHGYENPRVFGCYAHPEKNPGEAPHVHEYTPRELARTLEAAGFRIEMLTTGRVGPHAEGWVYELLVRNGFDVSLRGEQIYCRARKDAALTPERYPHFLYAG